MPISSGGVIVPLLADIILSGFGSQEGSSGDSLGIWDGWWQITSVAIFHWTIYNKEGADYFSCNQSMSASQNISAFPFQPLLICFLLVLTTQQAIVIRNLGCKAYDSQGRCTACSTRYYLDAGKICQPVNPNCNTYDMVTGGCLSCYPGFGLIEDTCLPGIVSSSFDPNCNTFNGSLCAKCSSGFFLNADGKCQGVDPTCKTFSTSTGACLSCFAGYQVSNGSCVVSKTQSAVPNCNQVDLSTGKCVKCSQGFFFDQQGNCQQADPNCKSFDSSSFLCRACYDGYSLNASSQCVKSQVVQGDPNCAKYGSDNICIQCSKGAIFNPNKVCIIIDPSCLTFDQNTGACTSCYSGYQIKSGNTVCTLAASGPNSNPYCAKWAGSVCQSCAKGSYFDSNGQCVVVDANCKDSTGTICNSCYNGYTLQNNTCVKSIDQPSANSLCAKWNGSKCTQCSSGTFLNSDGLCAVVNPLCMTFDMTNGNCLSCYQGYTLNGSTCVVSNSTGPSDPFCQKFLTNDVCSQCSDRYYIGADGICVEVNVYCHQYDQATGNCLTCFSGFVLSAGNCVVSSSSVSDPNCKTWNGSICLACAFGAYFSPNGTCLIANPLCKTFNRSNGNCLSCYDSFELSGGNCLKSNQSISDPNCAEFLQGICTKCSSGYFFKDDGMCGLVSSNCKTFDAASGNCLTCYLGFSLSGGSCVAGNSSSSAIDPNCAAFAAGACVRCSKNFYFDVNGTCVAVNPLCQTFDPSNGNCLSCYQSYVLSSGSCVPDVNGTNSDPNCASWLSGVCISCATRTFMNSMGLCENVNINCNTYNADNGQCTSCYAGFGLSNGTCSPSTSPNSCSKFDSNGKCVKCGTGSYLSQGQCLTIDAQCANFDQSAQVCTSCYPGYSILNGVCQISKVDSKDAVENCYAYDSSSQCIKCFDRYFLSANTCSPVSVFCKTYDEHSGNCLSCYSTFKLANGKCAQ